MSSVVVDEHNDERSIVCSGPGRREREECGRIGPSHPLSFMQLVAW
jgi:hypothetical protein